MKKITLVLFISLSLTSALCGQQNTSKQQIHSTVNIPDSSYKLLKTDILLEDSTLICSWDEKGNKWITSTATKTSREYDGKGRLIKKTSYSFDPIQRHLINNVVYIYRYDKNNNLIFSSKETLDTYGIQSYDSMKYKRNKLVSHKSFVINPISKTWCLESSKQYNKSGALISSFNQQYSHFIRPDAFKASSGYKSEIKTNSAGHIIEVSSQRFDSKTGSWQNNYKSTFSYVNNILLSERMIYSWDTLTASWQTTSRFLYSYSDTNYQTICQTREGSNWKNLNMATFIFNPKNNVISVKGASWIGDRWLENYKNQYNYDLKNQLTETSDSVFIPNFWINLPKETYRYDERGNLNTDTYTPYELSSAKLQYGTQYSYEYDSSGMLTQSIYYYWNTHTEQFVPQTKTCHYYSKHEQIPISKSLALQPVIYTDPTTDKLYFKNIKPGSYVLIYDIDGFLKIYSPIVNNQVDVGDLLIGQYSIQIVNKKGITRSKFISNNPHSGGYTNKVYMR
jgi:hypothetical protein